MRTIRVLVPADGPPIMPNEKDAVHETEFIAWDIRSARPEMEMVKIEFERKTATFFQKRPGEQQHYARRGMQRVKGGKQFPYSTLIVGRAPDYDGNPTEDKYSIEGLDARGNKLSDPVLLDPVILTDGPGGK